MKELKNLLDDTLSVLLKLADTETIKNYTFVGGSALTVYLNHRLSEDIDLFTWQKEIDKLEIQSAIENCGFVNYRLVNFSKIQADFIIEGVKVTFFASGWIELQNRTLLISNLHIANLDTLAIMKVNTLFLRAKFRDYYDLYFLNLVEYSLPQLYEFASAKIKNLSITLFQRALIFTDDIEDENIKHLKPIKSISLKEISTHFAKQIKAWNKNK